MEFWSPRYLADALDLLDRSSDSVCICAGLTHLLRFYSQFPDNTPEALDGVIHVGDVPSLNECREETGKYSLGSTARISELEADSFLARHAAAVWDSAKMTSTPQIRNRRSLGGELAWGSLHSPLITSLMAYDAEVRIRRAARSEEMAYEETLDLMDFYTDNFERSNSAGRRLLTRKACLGPRDLIIKVSIPESSYLKPGHFSFIRALTPKISTENPGVLVAVRGQIQGGSLIRAQFVVSGTWISSCRDEIPLEGVKLKPNEFFEKLYHFCDRYPLENYRLAGPNARQLSIILFGLMKEGFGQFMGYHP